MKYLLTAFFTLSISNATFANELWDKVKKGTSDIVEKSSDVISDTSKKVQENLGNNADRNTRAKSRYAANFNWSPVNVPFPMAWGLNGYYIANGDWMIGIDYLNSNKAIKFFSFEIGEIKEQAFAIQAKRFFGNSFNLKMGIGQRSTEAKLARNLFDLATKNYSETVSEFETKFIRLGIGNQWHFKERYTLAIDWISIDIPFDGEIIASASKYGKTPEDKKDIQDSEDILKYYPGGGIVKFDVGFIF